MSTATPDHWEPLIAAWHTRDTAWLQQQGKHLHDMIGRDQERLHRLNLTHLPGWAGQTGRPALGIIRIILLLRGAEVTF